jgi:hypothetical protein
MNRLRPNATNVEVIARHNDQAPGLPAGVAFDRFGHPVSTGHSGDVVAFPSVLTGAGVSTLNDSAAYIDSHGTLRLLAREGERPSGLPIGSSFVSDQVVFTNEAAQVVMWSRFAEPGIPEGAGLWFDAGDGIMQPLLRERDHLLVNGVDKTVQLIDLDFGELPAGRIFLNDAGQFTCRLRFTDNTSGIFIAQVPELPTVTIALVGLFSLVMRRRSDHAAGPPISAF